MNLTLIKTFHAGTGDRKATFRGKCYLALKNAIDPCPECSNFLWEFPLGIACVWLLAGECF